MSKVETAVACFRQGYNCAQALFSAYADEDVVKCSAAMKIACGLGAGMGRMAETCGAVSGALLAIGSRFGMQDAEDTAAKEKTYELVRKFVAAFRQRHQSTVCHELLPCDISVEEGVAYYWEHDLLNTRCTALVRDAAEILEQLITGESTRNAKNPGEI
jgi:C_GCAxxG_C_C family probable redox protein